jgi:hypothetical protein
MTLWLTISKSMDAAVEGCNCCLLAQSGASLDPLRGHVCSIYKFGTRVFLSSEKASEFRSLCHCWPTLRFLGYPCLCMSSSLFEAPRIHCLYNPYVIQALCIHLMSPPSSSLSFNLSVYASLSLVMDVSKASLGSSLTAPRLFSWFTATIQ